MKAAVIEKLGETPKYKDFKDPETQNDDQLVLEVKAAAVKNILPEMFQLTADGNLDLDLFKGKLEDIESLWEQDIASGKRLVISVP